MATQTNFIPSKLRVGFQQRPTSLNRSLGYVIYYDEKGKLRKETSFESWRAKDIEPQEHENTPQNHFLVSMSVTRGGWDYFSQQVTKIRIYDQRGWEVEITPQNFMYILSHSTVVRNDIEQEMVYGWHGTELVLIPTNSEIYKASQAFTNRCTSSGVSAKDLIIGRIYSKKNQNEDQAARYVYIGRHSFVNIDDKYNRDWYQGLRDSVAALPAAIRQSFEDSRNKAFTDLSLTLRGANVANLLQEKMWMKEWMQNFAHYKSHYTTSYIDYSRDYSNASNAQKTFDMQLSSLSNDTIQFAKHTPPKTAHLFLRLYGADRTQIIKSFEDSVESPSPSSLTDDGVDFAGIESYIEEFKQSQMYVADKKAGMKKHFKKPDFRAIKGDAFVFLPNGNDKPNRIAITGNLHQPIFPTFAKKDDSCNIFIHYARLNTNSSWPLSSSMGWSPSPYDNWFSQFRCRKVSNFDEMLSAQNTNIINSDDGSVGFCPMQSFPNVSGMAAYTMTLEKSPKIEAPFRGFLGNLSSHNGFCLEYSGNPHITRYIMRLPYEYVGQIYGGSADEKQRGVCVGKVSPVMQEFFGEIYKRPVPRINMNDQSQTFEQKMKAIQPDDAHLPAFHQLEAGYTLKKFEVNFNQATPPNIGDTFEAKFVSYPSDFVFSDIGVTCFASEIFTKAIGADDDIPVQVKFGSMSMFMTAYHVGLLDIEEEDYQHVIDFLNNVPIINKLKENGVDTKNSIFSMEEFGKKLLTNRDLTLQKFKGARVSSPQEIRGVNLIGNTEYNVMTPEEAGAYSWNFPRENIVKMLDNLVASGHLIISSKR